MLPASKTKAINRIYMGDGIKIFVEFKERFYPDMLGFGTVIQAMRGDEKFVYDAAFGKDATKHILALFAINDKATPYTQLKTEAEIINKFIAELDEIFEGKASKNYVKHVIQNWSAEPYIQGAYSYSFDGSQYDIVAEIKRPLQDKVFFAGEALSIDNQATVHGACESAYEVIENMLVNH
jgi:monoamine oxidase